MTGLLRALCLLLALLVGGAGAGLVIVPQAVAQAAGQAVDYEAWERTADRAEEAVENNRASTPALEALREDLAEWRDRFLAAQSENASTIATVRQQLAALGDAPEDGTESEDIAAQRQALTARLACLLYTSPSPRDRQKSRMPSSA